MKSSANLQQQRVAQLIQQRILLDRVHKGLLRIKKPFLRKERKVKVAVKLVQPPSRPLNKTVNEGVQISSNQVSEPDESPSPVSSPFREDPALQALSKHPVCQFEKVGNWDQQYVWYSQPLSDPEPPKFVRKCQGHSISPLPRHSTRRTRRPRSTHCIKAVRSVRQGMH